MLNSPMLLISQHFQAIPLRSPLISLRSKWRLTGFSRRFTPKNPVRLHNPFGELPRWGAKNVLPLNLMAFPPRGRCPEGAKVGSRCGLKKNVRCAPRFVIPSAAEGSFSFPISVFLRNALCMKHRDPSRMEHGVSRCLLSSLFLIHRKRKRFLACARNDDTGMLLLPHETQ